MRRFIFLASTLIALHLSVPGHADTELYQLRQGESPAVVAARTYGDKSYLAVLKQHTRLRARSRSMQLPSLRQILFDEKVQALEPNAAEKILQAHEDFLQASRASAQACDSSREWQPKERERLEQAARELTDAVGFLKEVQPAPQAMIAHLSRAGAGLQDLGDKRGKVSCKAMQSIHRNLAGAMASSIQWARREHRRAWRS
jgi:hypothetical protein